MLQPGDAVPHFTVRTLRGATVSYNTIWQRRNLMLIMLSDPQVADECYFDQITVRLPEFEACNTECVITRDAVAGLPRRGALVADKWGEIVYLATATTTSDLPSPKELLEWIEYLEHRCPECEGEAK